jgi:hypothetical protein
MTPRRRCDTITAAVIAPTGRAAAIILCAWLVAACGGLSLGSSAPDQGGAAPTEAAPEPPPAAPPPESAEASPAEETTASEAQVSTAVPTQPEQQIDDDPEQLMGMGTASLSGFLGAPELIRRESPASIWQYRADGCVLDIVLYPESGADKVSYIEAREDGLTRMPPRACLRRLLRARYQAPAG